MVLPPLDKVESAICQLKAALSELDFTYPKSAAIVVQTIHDRCIDPHTGEFILPVPCDCTEVARAEIELTIRQQEVLAKLTDEEKKTLRWPSLMLL